MCSNKICMIKTFLCNFIFQLFANEVEPFSWECTISPYFSCKYSSYGRARRNAVHWALTFRIYTPCKSQILQLKLKKVFFFFRLKLYHIFNFQSQNLFFFFFFLLQMKLCMWCYSQIQTEILTLKSFGFLLTKRLNYYFLFCFCFCFIYPRLAHGTVRQNCWSSIVKMLKRKNNLSLRWMWVYKIWM